MRTGLRESERRGLKCHFKELKMAFFWGWLVACLFFFQPGKLGSFWSQRPVLKELSGGYFIEMKY